MSKVGRSCVESCFVNGIDSSLEWYSIYIIIIIKQISLSYTHTCMYIYVCVFTCICTFLSVADPFKYIG